MTTTNCVIDYPIGRTTSSSFWVTGEPYFPYQIRKATNGFILKLHSNEYVFTKAEDLAAFLTEQLKGYGFILKLHSNEYVFTKAEDLTAFLTEQLKGLGA